MSNVTAISVQQDEPRRANVGTLMMNPESMDRIMRMADLMAFSKLVAEFENKLRSKAKTNLDLQKLAA